MKQSTRRPAVPNVRSAADDGLRLLLDTMPDCAVSLIGPQGMVLTWNEGATVITGYSADEIIGQHFSVFYPAEAIAADQPSVELDHAISGGRHQDEGWRVRKDGTKFWAGVVITAIRDREGRLRGFGTVTRDLTEQRATADLRAAVDALTGAPEVDSEQAVIVTAADGRITFSNARAEQMLGHGSTALLGQKLTLADDN